MEAHIHEWLNLLVRWIHFIVGIAWIGASFYFNWLENNLDRQPPQDPGIAGNLWAIHGGGFYHLKKFSTGPDKLPVPLHWFKWEAYTTWLSGVSLLVIVYYFNARAYLIDPSVFALEPWIAIAIGFGSLCLSWIVYDLLCRSALRERPGTLTGVIFLWFVILAWCLSNLLSGRAAFIHVGAAIGTIMVANVFFVIIPAQKEMVQALSEKRALDPAFGRNGLLRSRHNNYLTLPVLFTMISAHFPSTYGHPWNWLVLILIAVTGVAVRHYFNIRHVGNKAHWILPAAFAGIVAIMWLTSPQFRLSGASWSDSEQQPVSDEQVMVIINQRCATCHAAVPTQPGFVIAPSGLELDTLEKVQTNLEKVYQTSVVTKIMPLGNLSGMKDEERRQIESWYSKK
ncbi:MAG: urate hydroxylase PuuD [bacterium]